MFPTPAESLRLWGLDKPDNELLPNQRALKSFMLQWHGISVGPNAFLSVVRDDELHPVATVEISELLYLPPKNPHHIHLAYIQAFDKRQGWGSKVMTSLIDVADRHGVTIDLDIKPMGEVGKDPTQAGLRKFYRKFGFAPSRYYGDGRKNFDHLVREPMRIPDEKPWKGSPQLVALPLPEEEWLTEDELIALEEGEVDEPVNYIVYFGKYPRGRGQPDWMEPSARSNSAVIQGSILAEDDDEVVIQDAFQGNVWYRLPKRAWYIEMQNPSGKPKRIKDIFPKMAERAYGKAHANPGCGARRNPGTPGTQMLQLGRVVDLELDDGQILTPRKKLLLAWGRNNLHICVPVRQGDGRLNRNTVRAHREFHGTEPTSVVIADKPDMGKDARKIGLLKAITYNATGITSPNKKRHNYRHIFGDTGHAGEEDQPPSKFPAVYEDRKGNLFIKRRRGNGYTVDLYTDGQAWIIG